MSSTLRKYLNVLKFISSIKEKKLREGVLKQYANFDDFYKALNEIAMNTVNRNVQLTAFHKKKLKPYKKHIINLTKNNKSKRGRKKLVIQSGGFLQIL